MDNIWRILSNDEQTATNKYKHIKFGTFAPSYLQKIFIFIGQNSFLKRGLFRRRYSRMIFSLRKGPLDIYFRKCAYRLFGENNLIEYGILLDKKVIEYCMKYLKRDLHHLIATLDALDNWSLKTKKPITIPLLQKLIAEKL